MREFLTAQHHANAACLLRQAYSGSILIVEGGIDKAFLEAFIDREACHIMRGEGGKPEVLEIVRLLRQQGLTGFLALVDADFDRVRGQRVDGDDVFYPDGHDLEMMVFASQAFEKLLRLYGSEDKVAGFEATRQEEVREALLKEASKVGKFLYLSIGDCLGLSFKDLRYDKFVDRQTLVVDLAKLIEHVCGRTPGCTLNRQELRASVPGVLSKQTEPHEVCRGHDLVGLLAEGMRSALGNHRQLLPEYWQRCLLIAYEARWFKNTQLYRAVSDWETRNHPLRVFQKL